MPVTLWVPKHTLSSARKFVFYLCFIYVLILGILCIPVVQRHAAFQHSVRLPLGANFDVPEKYGFAPGKTSNIHIRTSDNVTLGAWFTLAEPYYQQTLSSTKSAPRLASIQRSLRLHPTVLFFHGAAASRAMPRRVRLCTTFSSRLRTNVLMIDYRGFGDSTGSPTEAGLALDAYTAWTWLIAQGAKPDDILILGHSLGTGVAGMLVSRLKEEGVKPRGVALMAPFTALKTLIQSYHLWGFPILLPLQSFTWGRQFLRNLMYLKIDTLSLIQDFHVPLLIAHATNDEDVPHLHSRTLVDRLLDPLLSPSIPLTSSPGDSLSITTAREARQERRNSIVKKVDIPNFGIIEEFEGGGGQIVYIESMWGSHNDVALLEGVQDEVAKLFRLGVFHDED